MDKKANKKSKAIMHKAVDCPSCGNHIWINSGSKISKCKWCKRYFNINITKHKGKFVWDVTVLDDEQVSTIRSREDPRIYSLSMLGLGTEDEEDK